MKKFIFFLSIIIGTIALAQTSSPIVFHRWFSSLVQSNAIIIATNTQFAITNRFTNDLTNKQMIIWNSNGTHLYLSKSNVTILITNL